MDTFLHVLIILGIITGSLVIYPIGMLLAAFLVTILFRMDGHSNSNLDQPFLIWSEKEKKHIKTYINDQESKYFYLKLLWPITVPLGMLVLLLSMLHLIAFQHFDKLFVKFIGDDI